MRKLVFLLSILILLVPVSVYSIGIIGENLNRVDIFVPNSNYKYSYGIRTNPDIIQDYDLSLEGPAGSDVTAIFNPKIINKTTLNPGQIVYFDVEVRVPNSWDPGLHTIKLCARETTSFGAIGGRTGSCALVSYLSYFEGIYPILEAKVPNVNENETLNMEVKIKNWGKENISDATMSYEIISSNNTLIYAGPVKNVSVSGKGERTFKEHFDTKGILPGQYKVAFLLNVKNKTINDSHNFNIGHLRVDVINHDKIIEIGKINPVKINLGSRWNNKIDGVFADVVIDKVKTTTASIVLTPMGSGIVVAYIDASNYIPGNKTAQVSVYYGSEVNTKDIMFNVVSPKVLDRVPVSEKPNSNYLLVVVLLIGALLVIVNLVYLLSLKKSVKTNKIKRKKRR